MNADFISLNQKNDINNVEKEILYIVILSGDYDNFHRKGSLEAMSQYGHVLILNKPAPILSFSLTDLYRLIAKIKSPKEKIINESLIIFRPYAICNDLFCLFSKVLSKFNQCLIIKQTHKILYKYNYNEYQKVVLLYHPYQIKYAKIFNENITIYECYDDYSASIVIPDLIKNIIDIFENKLTRISEMIIVTSKQLLENKFHNNSKVFHHPNGVDVDYFHLDRSMNHNSNNSVIGVLGEITEKTDIDLLLDLARLRSDLIFYIIGKNKLKNKNDSLLFNILIGLDNVKYFGWVSSDQLMGICQSFDAALIPYKIGNKLAMKAFPNKLFEYLAMGLPVVSTKISELFNYSDLVEFANDAEGFGIAISKLIRTDNFEKIEKRREIAQQNSWRSRQLLINDRVLNLLNKSSLNN